MAELTEKFFPSEDMLTPSHSIPANIHSLNVSGSKGHFSAVDFFPQGSLQVSDKPMPSSFDFDPKQYRFDQLYLDAAKRNAAKDKLSSYSAEKKEKETEKFKSAKKISKAASVELFERLNKEAESREERRKISTKIKEAQETKEVFQPKINKVSVNFTENVVTRLMQYGENSKRKIEERVRLKKVREDEEIKNTPSVHKKATMNGHSFFSNQSTPLKSSSNRSSPLKKFVKSVNESLQDISPSKPRCLVNNSLNSPEKIIQKMQNLIKFGTRAPLSPFQAKPREPIKPMKK